MTWCCDAASRRRRIPSNPVFRQAFAPFGPQCSTYTKRGREVWPASAPRARCRRSRPRSCGQWAHRVESPEGFQVLQALVQWRVCPAEDGAAAWMGQRRSAHHQALATLNRLLLLRSEQTPAAGAQRLHPPTPPPFTSKAVVLFQAVLGAGQRASTESIHAAASDQHRIRRVDPHIAIGRRWWAPKAPA